VIIDSSAIISVVMQEPDHERVVAALEGPDGLAAGSPTLFETGLVLCARFGSQGQGMLRSFTRDAELQPIAFADHHTDIAISAFLRYGEGRHPAKLNLGDCMSYAVARWSDEPLLCTGNDFAKTDLELVLADG
jgi:ribonuclease VapC